MTLGIVTFILFLLTSAKFATKRLPNRKLDAAMGRIHKPAAFALSAMAVVHCITALRLIRQRPLAMFMLGFLFVACIAAAVGSFSYAKRIGRRWIAVHRIAAAAMCLLLAGHVAFGVTSFLSYQKAVSAISNKDVAVARVADGSYLGEYGVGYIYAKVRVTVEDGKILSIDILEHRNERGAAAEAVAGEIVREQKTAVDTVSGATNSSKVIEKAVEEALA